MKKESLLRRMMFCLIVYASFNEGFSQINFVDSAGERGIDISCGTTYLGNGVTFYDYNQDGFDDITFTTENGQNVRFFKNESGNGFIEEFLNITNLNYQTKQVNWVDFDNDGDKDLFVTSDTSGNRLFENDGNLNFNDITSSSGLPTGNIYTYGASWGDYNNDGFLDVFISSFDPAREVPNYLYKNNGNGSFTNVSNEAGISPIGHLSFCSAFFDYNNDGWQDIYISNDRIFNANILYKNNGDGTFTDKSQESNTDIRIDAMSVTIDDFNKDGWFDIYVTNAPDAGNVFLKNNGNGTFSDIASSTGTRVYGVCWGAVFLDAENDQDLDLYVSSSLNGASSFNSSVFFENLGEDNFQIPTDSGFFNDTKVSHSNAIGDIDNDGLYDIVVSNTDDGLINLWENKTITSNNWLKVKLEGTASNKDGIGSIIEISIEGNKQYGYTLCGEGYLSQNSSGEVFGLGNNLYLDYVRVKWLSGIEDYFYNVEANQYLTLKEGTGNTNNQVYGCTDSDSCNYNPSATIDDGSCLQAEDLIIQGNTNSNPLLVEEYTCKTLNNDGCIWSVVNGEILNGQGTNTISVKWDIATNGVISVIQNNANCPSDRTYLQVNINRDFESSFIDYSVARLWNEVLLNAIRADYARPTIHARNLFHASIAMYDSWAIYNENSDTYFVGKEVNGFLCELDETFDTIIQLNQKSEAVNETLSYAAYRLLVHRFKNSPNALSSLEKFDELMRFLNYDSGFKSIDYSNGSAAALGNYIGEKLIEYGLQDGSNEVNDYENLYYTPANQPLLPNVNGNATITDPNRWQPLSLDVYIDQSGNVVSTDNSVPEFLSPEWGNTYTFALDEDNLTEYDRDSKTYNVYYDPGSPPYLGTENVESSNIYKWGFSLVSVWASHLSSNDGVMWDISPNSIGNISSSTFPLDFSDYNGFYKLFEGGDISSGHSLNPITNSPYEVQMVPRGDYARVLAEFWADGPDSETPPGHWFTILNYVNDHPQFEKKFEGFGLEYSNLEWEVKSYFILGGAMHDAAVASWSIKGWYDYIRPISAIRYMAEKGQSTDPELDSYNPEGIPLIDGYIEIVSDTDILAGSNGENIGKIKLYTWRGHDYISNTETDVADVGWILAEKWWPYQRPSFVTPPFAGYVSGHSTYSRAAAEVLTKLTGSAYFPGGLGEFKARKNEFLVFEEGPSQDIILQWATYRDASDQCSLSRIWGGIHPPMDDIPGRIIGKEVGIKAFDFAKSFFEKSNEKLIEVKIFPNPVNRLEQLVLTNTSPNLNFQLFDINGKNIPIKFRYNLENNQTNINFNGHLVPGLYILRSNNNVWKLIVN